MAAALTMTQTAQTMAHTALKTINNAQQQLHSITGMKFDCSSLKTKEECMRDKHENPCTGGPGSQAPSNCAWGHYKPGRRGYSRPTWKDECYCERD
ncbi:unnamed protein product [Vitrella brassicaformis CCMP3155]|uniref:Uncharacterized protein n=1 Tax=Vitrella brassicaformis (strain CCMP3155) TaxID=1169540 RepID=A0A0G4ET16_VITBC|nr:unnamed protein product [Vitrella brassicaformis CCMP3155]|mmetsp:Transcript_9989/g.28835  ORF Transcript_9989/g.28835 Transcript_9989/m.28835 type:complete len:96 (+) Transcript_9989:353-640(+)|eukprot:CEM00968.1 unnamed protein product [Vitrella brassicaformis CCMP3155]